MLLDQSSGEVIKGFGRGAKELGIPTANIATDAYCELLNKMDNGVYCGWANVDGGEVYKMVMSVGDNPFYHNVSKSIEVHLLHHFEADFYGSIVRAIAVNYIRTMENFNYSKDKMIARIKEDIDHADKELEKDSNVKYKPDPFFKK